ncbi:hypothetical protein [Pigmentiphaga litoralis]|jgi:DNA polymerase-3 subunit alpha
MLSPYRAEPQNGYPGTPVEIVYNQGEAKCVVRLSEDWRVRVPDVLLQQLGKVIGNPADVALEY